MNDELTIEKAQRADGQMSAIITMTTGHIQDFLYDLTHDRTTDGTSTTGEIIKGLMEILKEISPERVKDMGKTKYEL